MAFVQQISNGDGTEAITVIPCDCGDCTGTSVIVEQRTGRKVRRLELTLDAAAIGTLVEILLRVQEFHDDKDGGQDWPPCDLN